MNNNSNTSIINNEQLLLINILNTMYNDNIRQINNITDTLHNLNNTNNQIRNLLVRLLNSPSIQNTNTNTNTNNTRRNVVSARNSRGNNDRNINATTNRRMLNNIPYIIDTITEFTIPRNVSSSSYINDAINPIESTTQNLLNELLTTFMNPIEVYPTQSQIETATRRVRYCDILQPINTQCPISMEDFNDTDMVTFLRPCGHIFQTASIMNWFRSNCRCPVCRYDIRNYNSNSSTEFLNNSGQNNTQTNRSNLLNPLQPQYSLDMSNNYIERNQNR